jgi:hypothetical protein
MNNIIVDTNDLVKKYDFSSVITPADNQEAVNIIKSVIASGNYFTNSPKYQTKENIFSRPEELWLKYRMSFLFSVFMYLGREAKVANLMSWSYMTNLDTEEDKERYWHHHWHPERPDSQMLSGIFYLHIPDDVADRDTSGTEIAPNGPEGDGRYFVKPTDFSWVIYPSNTWHRPGILQSYEYRFILAADIEYFY